MCIFDTDAEELSRAFRSAWWQAHVAGQTLMPLVE
jgi:hypothetical protein